MTYGVNRAPSHPGRWSLPSGCAQHLRGLRHHGQTAIVERQALGAEAANYARIVMAAMMADPARG
jgi:hypothetical protein